MKANDVNANGGLSFEEFAAGYDRLLDQVDALHKAQRRKVMETQVSSPPLLYTSMGTYDTACVRRLCCIRLHPPLWLQVGFRSMMREETDQEKLEQARDTRILTYY